jgi:hypothetical protein
MADLSSLANIPGYGAYIARREMNEGQGLRDIQQASALLQLKNAIQGQQQEQQLRGLLSESAGDVEAAMNAALKAGRHDVAAKLAPVLEAQRRGKPQAQPIGAGGLRLPDGTVVPPAARPETPRAPTPTKVAQLIAERDALPAGDGRRAVYEAAIRKETEGAPKPEKTYPIVTTADGIFERRPEGLVPMLHPTTKQPLRATARERPITEFQGKNALYGSRALMADKTLRQLEELISTEGLATKQAVQNWPLIGGPLGAAANYALSKDQQAVEQAQRNFVNAVLRQESGAVISEQEFENAKKQYFPQPGDKKDVIEQKRKNRMLAIQGFKRIAGPAWDGVEDEAAGPQDILNQADAILKGK